MNLKGEMNEAVHWINEEWLSEDRLNILNGALLQCRDEFQAESIRVARFKEQVKWEQYHREAMVWIDKVVEPMVRG